MNRAFFVTVILANGHCIRDRERMPFMAHESTLMDLMRHYWQVFPNARRIELEYA